jgi:LysR family glycine cleavage system transcriptional activator
LRRSRLPLTALRAFEAAGRHQSFRKAADELAVSQAAISRQVRDLEAILGTPLFRREYRAVRLNETGSRLLGEVTTGFDVLDAALGEVLAAGSPQGVTISVEPTFATLFLVPRLAGFSEANPGLAINIEVGAALADLHSSGVHLAIRHSLTDSQWPGAQSLHLLDVQLTPMMKVPPLSGTNGLEMLRASRLLRDESGDAWSQWLAAAGISMEASWGPVFSDSAIALQSAASGQGAALGSRVLASSSLREGSLVAPFDEDVPHGAYWLLARDFDKLSKAERMFCEWLRREVEEVPEARQEARETNA